MSKSTKLYKDSPTVGSDEDGNVSIRKPSQAEGEDMGIEGSPLEGGEKGLPIQVEDMQKRHGKELSDMHKRHEDEHKDMHKRHAKEIKKAYGSKEEDKS